MSGPARAGGPLGDPQPKRRGGTSSTLVTEFLEALIAPSAFDQDTPIGRRPHDGPRDLWLARERPEPIPDWCLERVAQLVAAGPLLNIDELEAVESAQDDPVDATASARRGR